MQRYYSMTDTEYLAKPLIEDVKFEIVNDKVYVQCPHTSWCNATRLQRLTKEELLNLYKKVYNTAKEQGVTIGRSNHYKKYIEENWEVYRAELTKYNALFDEMIEAFKKVEKRGIHRGCSDDRVLNEAMDIRNKYQEVYWRSSVNSHMWEIKHTLEQYLRYLTATNSSSKVTKIVL